jgi:hypothetical protein
MSIDCDAWRAEYDAATVADQKRWHSDVYAEFPNQSHHSVAPMAAALERYRPRTVIELGGWDGEAAVTMLERFSFIEEWHNVEICAEAVANSREHPRFTAESPDRWYWEFPWTADMFVGAHVIEHLSAEHLGRVIDATIAPVFYVEAPINAEPIEWTGWSCLHRLEVGWNGVSAIFAKRGYGLADAQAVETKPESGGHSYCATYSREAA